MIKSTQPPFTKVLASLGYTIGPTDRPGNNSGAREILKDGVVVFDGTVFAVRDWLVDRGELPEESRSRNRGLAQI